MNGNDANSGAVISLRDVYRTYEMGDFTLNALDGVSVDIQKNEYVAIIGSSGSGKSTMMNICLLYTSPSPRDKRQSRMPSSA